MKKWKEKSEWSNKCDCCKVNGEYANVNNPEMFARMFYRKINGKWQYLCKWCWKKYNYYD